MYLCGQVRGDTSSPGRRLTPIWHNTFSFCTWSRRKSAIYYDQCDFNFYPLKSSRRDVSHIWPVWSFVSRTFAEPYSHQTGKAWSTRNFEPLHYTRYLYFPCNIFRSLNRWSGGKPDATVFSGVEVSIMQSWNKSTKRHDIIKRLTLNTQHRAHLSFTQQNFLLEDFHH